MDEQVQHALEQGGVIAITTRGRKTGQPRRIEIRFHHIAGQVYITGRPPFWSRLDAVRLSRPFISNAVSITMSRRGWSIAPW